MKVILPLVNFFIYCFILLFAIAIIIEFTGSENKLEDIQNRFVIIRIIFALLGVVCAFGIFYIYFVMFHHCLISHVRLKALWIIFIIFMPPLGAIVYYYFKVYRKEIVEK